LQAAHLDSEPNLPEKAYKNYGVNHIALVVQNIEDIEAILVAEGYQRSISTPDEKYRTRRYFFDNMGFEWERIEYSTDKPDKKFLYE
jgi:hypothetical protein